MAWRLAVRDIAAQYRQTFLGYFWAVAPPLANTLVWAALNGSHVISIGTGPLPYVVFALTGTIFWQLFFDCLSAPLKQLGANRSLLNRVNFPPESLILSGLIQVLFSLLIKLVLLAVVVAAYGVSIQSAAIAIILPAVAFIVTGFALGMFLAPIGLLYKDVEQALPILVGPLMLLAPVVYLRPSSGSLSQIMSWNPLTPLFDTTRALLYGGNAPLLGCTAVALVALMVIAASWVAYRLAMPILVERIEA